MIPWLIAVILVLLDSSDTSVARRHVRNNGNGENVYSKGKRQRRGKMIE